MSIGTTLSEFSSVLPVATIVQEQSDRTESNACSCFYSQSAHLIDLWDNPYLKLRIVIFPKIEMWVRKWSGVGMVHTAARALEGGNPDWND